MWEVCKDLAASYLSILLIFAAIVQIQIAILTFSLNYLNQPQIIGHWESWLTKLGKKYLADNDRKQISKTQANYKSYSPSFKIKAYFTSSRAFLSLH